MCIRRGARPPCGTLGARVRVRATMQDLGCESHASVPRTSCVLMRQLSLCLHPPCWRCATRICDWHTEHVLLMLRCGCPIPRLCAARRHLARHQNERNLVRRHGGLVRFVRRMCREEMLVISESVGNEDAEVLMVQVHHSSWCRRPSSRCWRCTARAQQCMPSMTSTPSRRNS